MIGLHEFLPIILLSGLFVCLITLVKTDFGIIVLIFSMLFSPELSVAQLGERAVVVRIDDILVLVVFFTWLVKMAVNKEFGLLKKSPLNLPITVFISISILSTLFGIIKGAVTPFSGLFHVLKYIEYFMIYFLVINNLDNMKQAKRFIAFLLITCFLVCVYTSTKIGELGIEGRLSAPFEKEIGGEPNTLGGYLLLLFAVSLGVFFI